MATQTIEFVAATGETITVRLYAAGSDTVAATASSVTEQTNRNGVYYAVVTSNLAGVYRLIATDASDVPLATWWVTLENANGTYIAFETPDAGSLTAARMETLDIVLIAANANHRTVHVTGSQHVAAVLHDAEPDSIPAGALTAAAIAAIQSGLATSANQTIIIDRVSYSLTALVGACSDAGTAAETYTLSIGGNTFTVDHAGLDATGNRGTVTLGKV